MTSFVLLSLASAAMAVVALILLRGQRGPVVANYRGRRVRAVLGLAAGFATVAVVGFAYAVSSHWTALAGGPGRDALWLALLIVFWAGVYDDLRPGRGRGWGGHLRELLHGRITPGIVKLVAIVGAAVLAGVASGASVPRLVLGVPVVAGAANVWNLLDVRPGRCLKAFLLAALALAPFEARHDPALIPAAFGAALLVLPLDLGEWGMLGDAGANVLGFVVGVALFHVLPVWALGVALAAVLLLHAIAETVTLSRVIESVAALRWFDGLGRRRTERRAIR